MEKGARAIALILLFSLLLGAVVVAVHPDYRDALRCLLRGEPGSSRIWASNESFYPEVGPEVPDAPHEPE